MLLSDTNRPRHATVQPQSTVAPPSPRLGGASGRMRRCLPCEQSGTSGSRTLRCLTRCGGGLLGASSVGGSEEHQQHKILGDVVEAVPFFGRHE